MCVFVVNVIVHWWFSQYNTDKEHLNIMIEWLRFPGFILNRWEVPLSLSCALTLKLALCRTKSKKKKYWYNWTVFAYNKVKWFP